MATGKITGPIGRTIRAAKKRGLGGEAIAAVVRDKHGIDLDRRSIDRWLGANPAAPPRKPRPPGDEGVPPADAAKPAPLDELETLEERARELKRRLDAPDLGPLAVATLNRELRQTFASIRVATTARRKAVESESKDTKWMIEKHRRYAAQNGGAQPPAEPVGLPEAPRAASG